MGYFLEINNYNYDIELVYFIKGKLNASLLFFYYKNIKYIFITLIKYFIFNNL